MAGSDRLGPSRGERHDEGARGTAPRERLLGIDLGERRIGVAVADSATGTVIPLTTIRRSRKVSDDAAVVARFAAEQRIGAVVVGLPLDMNGTEGPQALKTREWALAVQAATALPLRFRDERLTSVRAEQRLGRTGRGASGGPPSGPKLEAYRARIDREAAALILQDELDALAGASGDAGSGTPGTSNGAVRAMAHESTEGRGA
jgi:putative Holliday junction resolvase